MEVRISMPDVKITNKELIHMVSHGVVVKPDGTQVTMEEPVSLRVNSGGSYALVDLRIPRLGDRADNDLRW